MPFHTIHIDHVGPFETSKKKNKYLLVIVDTFTKFTIIESVRDTKAKQAVKVLLNGIHLFGAPSRIVSDRGTAFTARSFQMFRSTYGIRHTLNAVTKPRANGQCKRYIRTIVAPLATTAAGWESEKWDEVVKQIQSVMNTTHNKGIGTTPSEALMGYNAKHIARARVLQEVQTEIGRINLYELRKRISEHISKDQQK